MQCNILDDTDKVNNLMSPKFIPIPEIIFTHADEVMGTYEKLQHQSALLLSLDTCSTG